MFTFILSLSLCLSVCLCVWYARAMYMWNSVWWQKRVLTVVLMGTFWNSQICPTLYTNWLRRTPTSPFGKEQILNQCTKISRHKESQAISTPNYNTLDSRAYIGQQVMGSSATKTQESVLCVAKFHTSRTTIASANTNQPAIGTSSTSVANVARPNLSRARKSNFQVLPSCCENRWHSIKYELGKIKSCAIILWKHP